MHTTQQWQDGSADGSLAYKARQQQQELRAAGGRGKSLMVAASSTCNSSSTNNSSSNGSSSANNSAANSSSAKSTVNSANGQSATRPAAAGSAPTQQAVAFEREISSSLSAAASERQDHLIPRPMKQIAKAIISTFQSSYGGSADLGTYFSVLSDAANMAQVHEMFSEVYERSCAHGRGSATFRIVISAWLVISKMVLRRYHEVSHSL
jgi:hypothetical protein